MGGPFRGLSGLLRFGGVESDGAGGSCFHSGRSGSGGDGLDLGSDLELELELELGSSPLAASCLVACCLRRFSRSIHLSRLTWNLGWSRDSQ